MVHLAAKREHISVARQPEAGVHHLDRPSRERERKREKEGGRERGSCFTLYIVPLFVQNICTFCIQFFIICTECLYILYSKFHYLYRMFVHSVFNFSSFVQNGKAEAPRLTRCHLGLKPKPSFAGVARRYFSSGRMLYLSRFEGSRMYRISHSLWRNSVQNVQNFSSDRMLYLSRF